MARLLKGTMLSDEARREVLAGYVHRRLDTRFTTDADWLAAHAFYVRRDGKLSRAHRHCEPAFMAEYGEKIKCA